MSSAGPNRVCLIVALPLMLMSVMTAVELKYCEARVAMLSARAVTEGKSNSAEQVQDALRRVRPYYIAEWAYAAAALSAWIIAVWRGERQRTISVALAVLVTLYVMLQLIMV